MRRGCGGRRALRVCTTSHPGVCCYCCRDGVDAQDMSVFDLLERDDDGSISFDELKAFFQRSGVWRDKSKENDCAWWALC